VGNKYAIIDIETTGGSAKRDRITEIAIIISDGTKVIDTYESLVNPGVSIPYNITRITGINNQMVEDAPRFYEIAKNIVAKTEGCIFVAHNVQFDYNFIKNHFANLGYTFSKRRLCTVKMSRKAFPGLKSYSLGNLIKVFKIKITDRHRAMEDARATTIIFHDILSKSSEKISRKNLIKDSINSTKLPEGINIEFINSLPEECGVYYMSDIDKNIVYIGKSINIQQRIKQHFSKVDSKTSKMLNQVRYIDHIITGSELAAFIKEAFEIKKLKPTINVALKQSDYPYAVSITENEDGYKFLGISKVKSDNTNDPFFKRFSSLKSAKSYVNYVTIDLQLCKKINKLEKGKEGACFEYTIGTCLGACIERESTESYNERLENFTNVIEGYQNENFLLIEKGPTNEECYVFLIEEGKFKGYAPMLNEDLNLGIEEIKESIIYYNSDKQINSIIRNYINQNSEIKIINF